MKTRELTDRQRTVVALVRRGLSNGEIATEIGISEDGVKAHLSRLYLRFGAANRIELLRAIDQADAASAPRPSTLGELRELVGRARDRTTELRAQSGSARPRAEIETLRQALAQVDVALDLVRELPPETTGPVLDALRRRVSAAMTASEVSSGPNGVTMTGSLRTL